MDNELKDFSMAFKITNMVIFEVRYNHVGSNKDADFATSAMKFTRNKKNYEYAGQCQEEVLPKDSEAYKFYQKWDTKHLQELDTEEYSELLQDLETLKSNYEYLYMEGNRDFNRSSLVELSKIKTKKVNENKLEEDIEMEDKLRDLIQTWCEGDEEILYSDVDEVTDNYTDTFVSSEDLEEYGYDDNDYDTIRQIVFEVVDTFIAENRDIYSQAEEWDGNGYTNNLDDIEWQEIFENAPDVYKQALDRRAGWVKDWLGEMPDLVWNELEENVDEQLGFINYNPMAVIDNVIVNGSYGSFDDYKGEDETDEEFIAREENNCYRIFPEERFIIYSL